MASKLLTPEERAKFERRERFFQYFLIPVFTAGFAAYLFCNAFAKFMVPAGWDWKEVPGWKLWFLFYDASHGMRDVLWFIGGLGFIAFVCFFSLLWMKKVFSGYAEVFEQKPGKEDLIRYDVKPVEMMWLDRYGLNRQWVVNEFFKSEKDYLQMWQAFNSILIYDTNLGWKRHRYTWGYIRDEVWGKRRMVVFDAHSINNEVSQIAKSIVRLAKLNGTVTDEYQEKRALFIYGFCLFHFVTCFFGGVPTALISRYVKDYTLKRVLSLYQTGCTLMGDYKKDEEARELLLVFQSYRKIYYDVLEHLERTFSQIPPGYIYYTRLEQERTF